MIRAGTTTLATLEAEAFAHPGTQITRASAGWVLVLPDGRRLYAPDEAEVAS